jgi:ribosomal protein L11 methyltransferase
VTDAPRWIEVRVLAPLSWQELVAEALQTGTCTSVAFGRPSLGTPAAPEGFEYVRTFLPARDDTPAARARIAASVSALAGASGAAELAGLGCEFKPLPPEDYANSWKKVWKPFRVGRLCVVAPWSAPRLRRGDLVLRLEPGAAFGSGRHATTRAMLRALQGRLAPGERVLDAGTGSGILCVAAALLGARAAFGFDIDPNSAPAARELARTNGAGARCRFATAGFEALAPDAPPWDAVLANIYADLIQERAAELAARLAPGGWFAFSGCTAQHAPATAAAILAAGLALEETTVRGRWHTFCGRQPGLKSERRHAAPREARERTS